MSTEMPSPLGQVLDSLRARGLVPAEGSAPVLRESSRPWFVSLLLGAAGWLAGLVLLIFLGSVFRPEANATFIILGILLIGGARMMYGARSDNAFLGQLALALSMAGQISLAVGLLKDVNSEQVVVSVLLVLQLVVLVVMPDRGARVIAALFACIAWAYLVRFALVPDPDWDDWLFPSDGRLAAVDVAIAWLATWVPLLAICYLLVNREARWMSDALRDYLRPVLTGVLIVVAVGGFATEPVGTVALGFDGMGFNLGWWGLFSLLSIALSVYAAWCAFRLRNHGLTGLAVVGALLHLGRFYYHYGTSLLWKSAIMLGIGLVLLAGAWMLRQREERAA